LGSTQDSESTSLQSRKQNQAFLKSERLDASLNVGTVLKISSSVE
jgi:hypothetical protein